MKKSAFYFVIPIFFFLISLSFPKMANGGPDDVVNKVQPTTVMVFVFDQAGKFMAQGSGFLFKSPGHLITNYHVLGNGAMAKVRTHEGKEFRVRAIAAENKDDDLIEAIVDITSGSVPYLSPAGAPPKVGDPVMVIGSPYGVSKVVSQGTVTAMMDVPKYGKSILHSAHSFPGSSGSPLVNAQGEVIGIETAAAPGNPNVNLAIPLERFSGLSPRYRELQGGRSQAAATQKVSNQAEAPRKDSNASGSDDPAAQVKLAMMHEYGQGVSKNCFDALNLYRKAADRGFAPAEYHVGRMYYDGKCMGQNLGEAARWLGRAAERGFPDAQRLYANLFFNGEGVPKDRVNACMWIILAASQGQPEANRVLKYMSSELNAAEFKAAQEKAKNWKPRR